eukprot:8862167-Pyramimonas_sp.AAC.1
MRAKVRQQTAQQGEELTGRGRRGGQEAKGHDSWSNRCAFGEAAAERAKRPSRVRHGRRQRGTLRGQATRDQH